MRRSFGSELLLLVVTLGLYMPYWLWARNDEMRKALPDLRLTRNEVFLGVGVVLATFARAVFGGSNELMASFLSVAGITLFAYGAYVLADNAERAAEALGIAPRVPAWVLGVGLGLAFALVEAGNAVASWTVRGPALALVLAMPFAFHPLHETIEDVREEVAARAPSPPAPLAPA